MGPDHLPWHRTANYLFGGLFLFTIGYWVKKNLVILDGKVLISWHDSSYLSISFPLWGVNLIAGAFLLYILLLILKNFTVLQQQGVHAVVFCILLTICVLPLYAHFNYVKRLSDLYSIVVNSLGIVLCFRGLIGMRLSRIHNICSRVIQWIRNIRSRPFMIGMFIGCVLICGSISWHIFDGVPRFVDSCVYMFQARLFAHGTLAAPLPPEPDFFEAEHTILSDKWYTMYPPGYPAVLALGVLFRISWLVNPILAALTIVCIFLLAKELYGDNTAKLSAVLACASSFFLFMSSEFASHTSTLFL
ncbi:MAG: hypothetical protein OXI43_10210 [Candidatus Poribacteria bacterium]|nr:hypothetical protein [Candidatus Poribacteria bacterium]